MLTSSKESSAGVSPVGRVKLHTIVTMGSTFLPPIFFCWRYSPIQAPPRLPGRGWKSAMSTPTSRPSAPSTSKLRTSALYFGYSFFSTNFSP